MVYLGKMQGKKPTVLRPCWQDSTIYGSFGRSLCKILPRLKKIQRSILPPLRASFLWSPNKKGRPSSWIKYQKKLDQVTNASLPFLRLEIAPPKTKQFNQMLFLLGNLNWIVQSICWYACSYFLCVCVWESWDEGSLDIISLFNLLKWNKFQTVEQWVNLTTFVHLTGSTSPCSAKSGDEHEEETHHVIRISIYPWQPLGPRD